MANAWLFQRERGTGKPWSVGWYGPDKRRREKKCGRKTDANIFRKTKEIELERGDDGLLKASWAEFRTEYEELHLSKRADSTASIYRTTLNHFETIVSPLTVSGVTSRDIAKYSARRLRQSGSRKGSKVSPATVKKELRTVKAVLRLGKDWGYARQVPKIQFEKEKQCEPTFVSSAEFSKFYDACEYADYPRDLACEPADWWRALLLFQYMTGWRISEVLAFRKADLIPDGDVYRAVTRAGENKGSKEARVELHPLVGEHLKKIKSFKGTVFNWPHRRKTLWECLNRIQKKAGIEKVCRKAHRHSDACKNYGFHDFRRGFATENAGNVSASELQTLMRHSSYQTTQLYINMAKQAEGVASKLAVPKLKPSSPKRPKVAS